MAYRTVTVVTDSNGTVLGRPVTEAELAALIQKHCGLYTDVQATLCVMEAAPERGSVEIRELSIQLNG